MRCSLARHPGTGIQGNPNLLSKVWKCDEVPANAGAVCLELTAFRGERGPSASSTTVSQIDGSSTQRYKLAKVALVCDMSTTSEEP